MERSGWEAHASYTAAPRTSRWMSWQVCRGDVWGCQGCWAPRDSPSCLQLPPGLLLRRRTELRPLRVYSEQSEATEFPLPGVGSKGLLSKNSWEGRPNQNLRFVLSVCTWMEVRDPSCPDCPLLGRSLLKLCPQEHHPASPNPAALQPVCPKDQEI
jgi:hypothetical protein